jgi:hypothetical protein
MLTSKHSAIILTLATLVTTLAGPALAWTADGRFDSNGAYIDPVQGHTAACLRYESSFVAPATIGGLVNGLEKEQQAIAQLRDAGPGKANTTTTASNVITIQPDVLPPTSRVNWLIHTHNGHMMIGGQ